MRTGNAPSRIMVRFCNLLGLVACFATVAGYVCTMLFNAPSSPKQYRAADPLLHGIFAGARDQLDDVAFMSPVNCTQRGRHVHGRFIVFNAPFGGQGIGNLMQGLFGAHALAQQHNRTVCVRWPSFERAFESLQGACEQLRNSAAADPRCNPPTMMSMGEVTPEQDVELRKRLASADSIISISTNRIFSQMSKIVDMADGRLHDVFDRHYRPTAALGAILSTLPSTGSVVVHLRLGDHWPGKGWDGCRGVFCTQPAAAIWRYLRKCLPQDAYILGDHEDVYHELREFKHPPWQAIGHSASPLGQSRLSELRMWTDWMAIRRARHGGARHRTRAGAVRRDAVIYGVSSIV